MRILCALLLALGLLLTGCKKPADTGPPEGVDTNELELDIDPGEEMTTPEDADTPSDSTP